MIILKFSLFYKIKNIYIYIYIYIQKVIGIFQLSEILNLINVLHSLIY